MRAWIVAASCRCRCRVTVEHARTGPRRASGAPRRSSASSSALPVSIGERARRRGIASRALTARFMQHLLELAGVGARPAAAPSPSRVTSSMSSPISRRSIVLDAADDVAQVERPAAAAPARRLKASSWRVSAAARSPAAVISSTPRARSSPARRRRSERLAVADDHRQQVVEVVGDAAGEPADRLHLLRLPELLLERPPLGDVHGHRDQGVPFAGIGGRHQLDRQQHGAGRVIAALQHDLDVVHVAVPLITRSISSRCWSSEPQIGNAPRRAHRWCRRRSRRAATAWRR